MLRALPSRYDAQVSLVYADPPYNTGYAWRTYGDRQDVAAYIDGLRATFEELPRLLAPHGSVWVSIDDRAVHHVRTMLDAVFGSSSFVATCVWQKRCTRENRGAIGDSHEYLLVYACNPKAFGAYRNLVALTETQRASYSNPNNDPKGPWRTAPLTAQSLKGRPGQYYDIYGPDGVVRKPPKGRCWSLSEANFNALREQGRVYFGRGGTGVPQRIMYLSEVEGVVPWTWWPHEDVGHTQEAKREQYKLFGQDGGIDTPKPERLLARVIEIASHPGDLVVDPFAGSGTTGAVATKLGRPWLLIDQAPQAVELAEDRLRRVVLKTDDVGISPAPEGHAGFDVYTHEADGS